MVKGIGKGLYGCSGHVVVLANGAKWRVLVGKVLC